jgi:hypothetical protein
MKVLLINAFKSTPIGTKRFQDFAATVKHV